MGMYTELILGCRLKKETPQILIQSLNYIINKGNSPEDEISRKKIKQTLPQKEIDAFIDEWNLINLLRSSSYYIGAPVYGYFCFNSISENYELSTRSNSTGRNLISEFVQYIKPFVEQGTGPNEIFAMVQYEEDEFPTLYGLTGEFHYLDPEIEKNFTERYNKQIDSFNEIYEVLFPNSEITDKMVLEKGYDPATITTEQIYDICREKAVEEIKRLKAFDLK